MIDPFRGFTCNLITAKNHISTVVSTLNAPSPSIDGVIQVLSNLKKYKAFPRTVICLDKKFPNVMGLWVSVDLYSSDIGIFLFISIP